MFQVPRFWLLALIWLSPGCGGKSDAPSPAEIADRGWRAHELVIAAGENAKSCADAGPAMQRVFAANRQAFVDALALDADKARLREAVDFIEKHEERYKLVEARMEVLLDRCGHEPTVAAAYRQMESP
jgi:hypothetical protein